jgi:uncharacterized Zn-binding protein involved in type VI secretion
MSQFVIVVGDKTSHGGVVISGAPTTDVDGKPVARIGDKVTCPCRGHGGVNVIVSGDPTCIVDGQPIARHGDKTACGATLLSSQVRTSVDTGGGGSGSSNASIATGGSSETRLAATTAVFAYDEQVRLAIVGNRATLVGLPWFIKTSDGRSFKGRLGPDGQLPRIDSLNEEQYEVLWGDDAAGMAGGNV